MDISKLDNKINPSGTMAISNKARELKKEGKPVIGFGAGEPDFASPDYVVNEVKIAADDPKNHKYSPVAGLESLRKEYGEDVPNYIGRKKLLWDGEAMKITNFDEANQIVSRNYRKGWELI